MLPDEVKQTIQEAYKDILHSKSLNSRYGQRLMIAEIANCLSESVPSSAMTSDVSSDIKSSKAAESEEPAPVCVVEAGTGTGKTLAYVLGTLPVAQYLGKKVVLATATVALQEQVTLKDLPDIKRHSNLDFSYTLAKGRGRYLCLSRLDLLLRGSDSRSAMEDLYGEVLSQPDEQNLTLYENMLDEITAGRWHGDRDDWQSIVTDDEWRPVTVDNGQCMGQKCSNFSSCCFYQAREEVHKADCVVANHDLVLADLALGGGVILPHPSDTIYIFDEAHHLPLKSNKHFACFTRLRATGQWLEQCARTLVRLTGDNVLSESTARHLKHSADEIHGLLDRAGKLISESWPLFQQFAETALEPAEGRAAQYAGSAQASYSFPLGVVPDEVQELAGEAAGQFSRLVVLFDDIGNDLKADMEEGQEQPARQRAEEWFPLIGSITNRAESTHKLWHNFSLTDPAGDAPWARWLSVNDGGASGELDITLSASPVLAARTLQDKLWQECSGAVLTSATLSALGRFDVLNMRAGLPAHSKYFRIASPFDYQKAGRFVVPRLNCEPGDSERHTQAIIDLLPRVLKRSEASLMLFSSRRQMTEVLAGLPAAWRELVLCQDDYQKAQLLKYHRQRVDRNEPSIIFGLASFAEGVDLPGKYCVHVLIARIPFAVPNDPIEATLAQWVEQQGKNPFMTLSVPEAAFRLLQASGRLLRNESDRGRITLFDERIVNKFYGQAILDSLPPYRREIFPQLESETAS